MKSVGLNLLIVIALIGLYYVDFFKIITSGYALLAATIVVIILMLIALKLFGSPFGKDDKNENK